MLEKYFGAKLDDDGEDIRKYVRTISRKWCIGAVARALKPGCKMDNVLILEGMQGIGKTQAVEVLGGDWFSGARIDPHNKDSLMAVAQAWISELGEIGTFRRNSSESLKDFFSKRTDQFRRPYGRVIENRPRRCVFVGTTNKDEYLNDDEGERRYWPIACGKVDVEGLRNFRDQIWAEAVALFRAGEIWWLTNEEDVLRTDQTDNRAVFSDLCEAIENWIVGLPLAQRPRKIQATEMRLLLAVKEINNKGGETRITSALKKLGFVKRRERIGTLHPYYWYTPSRLLDGEQNRSPGEIGRLAADLGMSVVKGGTRGDSDN